MTGKRFLVNAGPTQERIDPVRYISNYSSGRMGVALASAAADYGAEVQLVIGPVSVIPDNKSILVIPVTTADEMASECISRFGRCDVAILAAAVADYTPVTAGKRKLKRTGDELILKLRPTKDISAELGRQKKKNQIVAGFALETDNEIGNAKLKLEQKNLDLIVLNSLKDKGAGFGFDTNVITIIDSNNNIDKFELKSKYEAAEDILDKIVSMLKSRS